MTELTEYTTAGRMHVVRHSFEPSLPLARKVEQLFEDVSGADIRPRFLLRSSKEVYVDSVAYSRGVYREQDEEVRAAIEKAKRQPFVIARAAIRLIPLQPPTSENGHTSRSLYRLSFLPTEPVRFQELAETLDMYPSAAPAKGPKQHYLYFDVPVSGAVDHLARVEKEAAFKDDIEVAVPDRLYAATVHDKRTIEVPLARASRLIPRPEQQ